MNSQESQDDLALASILGSPKRARSSGALLRLLGRLDTTGPEGTWQSQSRGPPKAKRRSELGELGDGQSEGELSDVVFMVSSGSGLHTMGS